MVSRFRERLLGLVILLVVTSGTPGEDIPPNKAILEVDVPAGATVAIDGAARGSQRRFVCGPFKPGERFPYEVSVRWPGREEVRRTVLLEGGWHVRLPVPIVPGPRPELLLQSGHADWVTTVRASPNSKFVLTGSRDRTIRLWDAQTGHLLRIFSGHSGDIVSVAISPTGQQVLSSANDGTCRLWDTTSGQVLRTFREAPHLFGSATFSPDGKRALTETYHGDQTWVTVWDVLTGEQIRTIRHDRNLKYVTAQVSADGKYVVTTGEDQPASWWDAATGDKLRDLPHDAVWGRHVAFRSDGKQMLSGKFNALELWDPWTGKKIRSFAPEVLENANPLFSPDGKQVLANYSFDKSVLLWEVESGRRLQSFAGHTERVVASVFTPDGQKVLTGSWDRTAALWDVATGRRLRTFQGNAGWVRALGISAQGQLALNSGYDTVPIWDLPLGQLRCAFRGHSNGSSSLVCSPDGKRVLSCSPNSTDQTAHLWNPLDGQIIRRFPTYPSPTKPIALSPDGKWVVTQAKEFKASLFDARTGAELRGFVQGPYLWIDRLAFRPDSKALLTTSFDEAMLWDVQTGEKLQTFKHRPTWAISAMAFSPDGKRLLTGHSSSEVDKPEATVLWDVTTGRQLRIFEDEDSLKRAANPEISAVAFSPNGKLILTGSWYHGVVLWDAETGHKLRTFPSHSGAVTSLAFCTDGQRIITGSYDCTARLWDLATGDELIRLMVFDDGQDWAVVTPEGLFDGSRGGREKVFFRIGTGLDVVPLDRFFQDFYYPGLLAEIWRGQRPMPGKFLTTNPAPLVKMLVNPDAERKGQVHLDVAVTDQGGGIKGPWLQHNGATLSTGRLLTQEGKTHTYRFPVALVPGANRLEVRAATADGGRESDPVATTVPFDGRLPKPDLYVVAVGINRYARDAGVADLDFCVPDTKAIAELFRQRAGILYKEVHVRQLLDEQATKAGILQAVAALAAQAQPQDALVLYVAGHGIALGQRFYVIPHDFQLAKGDAPAAPKLSSSAVALRGYRGSDERETAVRARGLAIDELGEELAKVPALKRVLIFDTCHSGSAIRLAGKQHNPFAFRGAVERFSRAQGVYSLSATAADELAAETKELGHSILTYALLAGMKAVAGGPLDDKPVAAREGAVDVLGWFGYVRQQVPGLYLKYVGRPQQIEVSGDDQPTFPLLSLESK